MESGKIQGCIYDYIKQEVNFSQEFDVNVDLIDEGMLDSMAIIGLIAFLEEKFQIKIEFDDINMENFSNIHLISEFVQRTVRSKIEKDSSCIGAAL